VHYEGTGLLGGRGSLHQGGGHFLLDRKWLGGYDVPPNNFFPAQKRKHAPGGVSFWGRGPRRPQGGGLIYRVGGKISGYLAAGTCRGGKPDFSMGGFQIVFGEKGYRWTCSRAVGVTFHDTGPILRSGGHLRERVKISDFLKRGAVTALWLFSMEEREGRV